MTGLYDYLDISLNGMQNWARAGEHGKVGRRLSEVIARVDRDLKHAGSALKELKTMVCAENHRTTNLKRDHTALEQEAGDLRKRCKVMQDILDASKTV